MTIKLAQFWKKTKETLKPLILASIVSIILSWSEADGVLVGVLFGLSYMVFNMLFHLQSKEKEEREEFGPIMISILPNWKPLLVDYQLIDEAGWEKLRNSKIKPDSVLTKTLSFSILCPVSDGYLVYYPDSKHFLSKVAIEEDIKELGTPGILRSIQQAPAISVTEGREGYEIKLLPKDRDPMLNDHDAKTIAVIPYSLFGLGRFRYGALGEEETKSQLEKYGWAKKDRDFDYAILGAPNELEHKYFTVYWQPL